MLIQVFNGYYNFELGLYFFHVYAIIFPTLVIWAMAAVFVHSLISNLYLSLFVLIGVWLGIGSLGDIGLSSYLVQFNAPPRVFPNDLDGYADQFGGESGKKYKYKTFKKFLMKVSQLPVEEQYDKLIAEYDRWKGDFEQIDDVLVIGVRVE